MPVAAVHGRKNEPDLPRGLGVRQSPQPIGARSEVEFSAGATLSMAMILRPKTNKFSNTFLL